MIITIERLISVIRPHDAKRICTKRNSCLLLIVTFIAISAVYIPILFSRLDSQKWLRFGEGSDIDVYAYCGGHDKLSNSFMLIDNVVRIFIPFAFMLLCNIIIIAAIYQLHTKLKQTGEVMKSFCYIFEH